MIYSIFFVLGSANAYRVYIAHNSTEQDRPKAVAICSFAPGFGLLVGTSMYLLSHYFCF